MKYVAAPGLRTNLWFRVLAGNCLAMAQGIFNAPVMHPSATDAANATQHRHYDRNIPEDAPCVLWFDHYGAYGTPGNLVWKNWGHVVDRVPGYGLGSSSPVAGETSGPYWYASIADIERVFSCTFRFWSEDINGLRVCVPVKDGLKMDKDVKAAFDAINRRLDTIGAKVDKTPARVLAYKITRKGTVNGKPRTGYQTLKSFLATYLHQVGVTRRSVESTDARTVAIEKGVVQNGKAIAKLTPPPVVPPVVPSK